MYARAMRTSAAAAAAIVVCLVANLATAQEQPPDIVRLRDGGLVRGTISEYHPGEYVVIVLQNGEERRFEASVIESAGPASEEQPPAPPPPALPSPPINVVVQPAPPPTATVRFVSEQPGLRIFRLVGISQHLGFSHSRFGSTVHLVQRPIHEHVCDAPCEAVFALGVAGLGVSTGGRVMTPDDPRIGIAGPTRVNVRWNNRETVRVIGAIVALAGGLLGAAVAIGGIEGFWDDVGRFRATDEPLALAISGGVLMATSLVVGFSLAFWWDGYRLEQDPPAIVPEVR
jgi:hypothetical protein